MRQGRTDAWIAHKIDVSIDELSRFKREHDLVEDDSAPLRPADPLSVPAPEPAAEEPDEEDEPDVEEEDGQAEARPPRSRRSRSRRSRPRRDGSEDERRPRERVPAVAEDEEDVSDETDTEEPGAEEADGEARRPRRRRGRRGGRRHRPRRNALEATFDHGEDGYGLWLDPAVVDNPVYSEHWAGHRAVTVTLEADSITIRRAGADRGPEGEETEAPEESSEEPRED